ncbi:S8 family serine peptidase [Thermobifida halotolerans]|uniref:S8 family serine peptidase n=2 Tax=Thermobifida halotolerans TaxID=483545 RepID=A0AA97M2L2_9ACTN|nr:S8 family serine peptidase [Thermobifida halotolerans]
MPTALPQVNPLKSADHGCVAAESSVVEETPWTHNTLGLAEVHRLNRGKGVTVAVLATAVDGGTPALDGAVEGGGSDCLGFGTFLSGIVAARPVPGSGFVGVAPEAEVVAVATGAPQTGVTTAADLAASIRSATSSGADVILVGTAAWEGSEDLDEAVSAAEEAGALVVAPATALGPEGTLPGHPAQHSSVLSVAAHQTTGEPVLSEPVPLSGDEEDGEGEKGGFARVDLHAPGDRVLSVGPGDDGHFVSGGDGVAAAFVAGAAALVRSGEPELTPAQVRERLLTTAYPSPLGADDPLRGHGRVDPLAAVTGSPGGSANTVPGEGFVPDPSSRGSVETTSTAAVVGVAGFVIVLCVLAGLVVRRGRARRWRPAAPGEPITSDGP